MYYLSAFYTAYTIADIPLELALPTVFLTVLYWVSLIALTDCTHSYVVAYKQTYWLSIDRYYVTRCPPSSSPSSTG